MANPGDTRRDEPFRFAVTSCFTITGRGVVVGGEVESGSIRVGDTVELVHAGWVIRMQCAGIQSGHGRGPEGTVFKYTGLLLPGVRRFDVAVGDHVRGVVAEHAP